MVYGDILLSAIKHLPFNKIKLKPYKLRIPQK